MNIESVKRVETVTIEISDPDRFELPVNVYGGSGNGGKHGREALADWQRQNPGVERIPPDFISPHGFRPDRVVVTYEDGVQTSALAYSHWVPQYAEARGGIPSKHWPQWLLAAVEVALNAPVQRNDQTTTR